MCAENVSVEKKCSIKLEDLLDGNGNGALQIIEGDAQKGNAAAMELLAVLYEYGAGEAQKDEQAALDLHEEAAEKGNIDAVGRLARAYRYGELGLKRDDDKAFELAKEGALSENLHSILVLARLYTDGQVVDRNIKKAIDYYQKAAEWKDPISLFLCGKAFYQGLSGVVEKDEIDKSKGEEMLAESAELGNYSAMKELAKIYSDRSEFLEEAEEWLYRAYLIGNKKEKSSALSLLGAFWYGEAENLPAKMVLQKSVELDSGNKDAKEYLDLVNIGSELIGDGDTIECSFCCSSQDEVNKLIKAENNCYICDRCVKEFVTIARRIMKYDDGSESRYLMRMYAVGQICGIKDSRQKNSARDELRCIFCHKPYSKKRYIMVSDGLYGICNECIDLCLDIIKESEEDEEDES